MGFYQPTSIRFTFILRLVAGTALLPLALASGLLTFPTMCRCGVELPHGHALYELADHSHAPGMAANEHPTRDGPTALEARTDGPTLHAPATVAAGEGQADTLGAYASLFRTDGSSRPPDDEPARSGIRQAPDPPPPRL